MHFFLYSSRAVPAFNTDDLPGLLARARAFNEAHGLTGLLLYARDTEEDAGSFMQYVEGPDVQALADVRVRIEADVRHRSIEYYIEGEREDRLFPEWSMAYSAERLPVGGEGFLPIHDLIIPDRKAGDAALHILELFRRAALHLRLG